MLDESSLQRWSMRGSFSPIRSCRQKPADRDNLDLPLIWIEDGMAIDDPNAAIVRSIFDMFWQCFNLPECDLQQERTEQ